MNKLTFLQELCLERKRSMFYVLTEIFGKYGDMDAEKLSNSFQFIDELIEKECDNFIENNLNEYGTVKQCVHVFKDLFEFKN